MDIYKGQGGESVVDYVVKSRETKEKVKRIEIGEIVDSDHHPVVL